MASLSDGERVGGWSGLMDQWSNERAEVRISKAELRAAVDATDGWIDANTAGFNDALPPAAKSELTQKQKVLLFMYVAAKRYEVV